MQSSENGWAGPQALRHEIIECTRIAHYSTPRECVQEACVGGPAPEGITRFSTSLTVVAFPVAIAIPAILLSLAEVGMLLSAVSAQVANFSAPILRTTTTPSLDQS